jgi:lysozyme family protein
MTSFEQYQAGYLRAWGSRVRPRWLEQARASAVRIMNNYPRYDGCVSLAKGRGPPRWFYGLVHMRESSFNFSTFLGNGQGLNRVTTIEPRGEGPFVGPQAFERGAVRAMDIEGFLGDADWGIARTLWRLEKYNGFGYHSHGVNSPYLWSGTTAYGPPEARGGKFVRDHDFRPDVVDTQLGSATVLKVLMTLDETIKFDGAPPVVNPEPSDILEHGILWVQHNLNILGATPPLVEDGINGRNTKAMVARFQSENGLTSTGLPDPRTIDLIEAHITELHTQAVGVGPAVPVPTPVTPAVPVPPAPSPAAPVPPPTSPAAKEQAPESLQARLHVLDDHVREHLRKLFG